MGDKEELRELRNRVQKLETFVQVCLASTFFQDGQTMRDLADHYGVRWMERSPPSGPKIDR